ncbi:MAG: GNAT family N-acetyltransferase [Ruminococcus sp.]|uniref:aminoglycoside 6'-N-acetyltransferase n=1 Tax=Ruminococcus sp. TaxID=41978 RepID=UPI0028735024|nr:aminoglycoside 6'-N-acetyltransferase [Ruminococcus sp.]MBQ3285058.1 GNAT family N-acetyltransferase [Ruminococcus sp.]
MKAERKDAARLADLVKLIWSGDTEQLTRVIEGYIASDHAAVFAQTADNIFVGAAVCSLRHDYVEGCETSPVGYLEGISVKEAYRHRGIAKSLLEECEQWAREKGCREFASDCELTNTDSLHFHRSIGFHEANRIICFTKKL